MRWKKISGPLKIDVEELSEILGIPRTVATLLLQRGIEDFDSAKDFFRPKWSNLHDPFLMQDMKAAVLRIQSAIENGERVMVYGDYDVDGTSSVALVSLYLKDKIAELLPYIPDRYSEGYGVSEKRM